MYTFLKRLLDFLVAALALVLLIPLIAFVAIAIQLTMHERAFFTQVRLGLHAKPFTLIKFRTMRNAVDERGQLLPDAERITRLGNLLRALSVDELPQFWNVLCGKMSLVGPRPLLAQYLHRYSKEQARRHEVKPGITGWAQANGRNALTWEDKFALDVWYVDHRSFWVDLKILWLTAQKVICREGIQQYGHATMPEFLGSQSSELESK